MTNDLKNVELGTYAFYEFDTWSPLFSFGAKEQQTRILLMQQYLNCSINNLNRNYKLTHEQQLSTAPDSALQHKLKASIIKKDNQNVLDTLDLDLPLGLYGPGLMSKIIMQKIVFYVQDDEFDYQITLSDLKHDQLDGDIVCKEGLRLICEGSSPEELIASILEKFNSHKIQIKNLLSSEVTSLRMYSLKQNHCWKECMDKLLLFQPNTLDYERVLNGIIDRYFDLLHDEYCIELIITSANTSDSIDIKVYDQLVPISKYSTLKFTLPNENIKEVFLGNGWLIEGGLNEMFYRHPASEFPVFLFEVADDNKYKRSWCFHVRKEKADKFHEQYTKIILDNFKSSDCDLVFLFPTDSKELGYLLEIAELKAIAKDGIIDCYPREVMSSINSEDEYDLI